jgi:predicted ribonuclease YlaK
MATSRARKPTDDQSQSFVKNTKSEPYHEDTKQSHALKIRIDDLKTFEPLTDNQKLFFDAYRRGKEFIVLHGVAGCGKTIIGIYLALEQVLDKSTPYKRLVIVRSSVQSREIGYLPGSLVEKMEAFEMPYIQICESLFGKKESYVRLKEQGQIQFLSTSFLRGCTFDDSIILVDELENCNLQELSTIVTRVGSRSKIILTGDYRQNDLYRKRNDVSGLPEFFEILKYMPDVVKIEFDVNDILRSELVKNYIIATMKYEDSKLV